MKFSMMRDIYHAAPSAPVGGRTWTDADHDVFIFVRLNVFLMYTAFRLGEIVAHRSGELGAQVFFTQGSTSGPNLF